MQDTPTIDVDRHGLLMATDPQLLDTVLRSAAAAGVDLHRVVDPVQARRHWSAAPLVLLDPAAAAECARHRLPRRDSVFVVARGEPPPQTWRLAVDVGAEHVVPLPGHERWLVGTLAEAANGRQAGGVALAVVGGRGGAGATVFSACLAATAVRLGGRALLVDCDPFGGGIELVFGAEQLPGLRWPQVGLASGRVPVDALHAALPAPSVARGGGLAVLSCDRSGRAPAAEAVTAVLESGRRAGETVVCDLPRQPGPSFTAAVTGADLTVLVVASDVRSCAAAARVADAVRDHGGRLGVVVRGPAPGGLRATDVAGELRLPLLAAMRPDTRLDRALEAGRPPRPRGPLAQAAQQVLAAARRDGIPGPAALEPRTPAVTP